MKICILCSRFPFPENGGDALRINNIARYLKSKNHSLVLISFHNGEIKLKKEYLELYDEIHTIRHLKIFAVIFSMLAVLCGKPIQCGYYFSPMFSYWVKKTEQQVSPDIYIAHLLRTTSYVDNGQMRRKVIVEMTDALSRTYALSNRSESINIKKYIYIVERNLIRKYEKKVILHFPKIVLVSQKDIDLLKSQNHISGENLVCHTNGVKCKDSVKTDCNGNKIGFIGNMRTLQNQDAVFFFVREIFPLIKCRCPDSVFKIIGAEPSKKITSLSDGKNIVVTGFVEDLESEIADCRVSVAPVRIAAGIQNKVLFSMACGVPVVLTSLIAKAIPSLKTEKNCFIADTPREIADAVIKIIQNGEFREYLSKEAYNTIKQDYSWNKVLEGYEEISFYTGVRNWDD